MPRRERDAGARAVAADASGSHDSPRGEGARSGITRASDTSAEACDSRPLVGRRSIEIRSCSTTSDAIQAGADSRAQADAEPRAPGASETAPFAVQTAGEPCQADAGAGETDANPPETSHAAAGGKTGGEVPDRR